MRMKDRKDFKAHEEYRAYLEGINKGIQQAIEDLRLKNEH